MKTILTFLFAGSLISFSSSAQTIKENIEKAAKDKNTMDRSAKADVLIQKKTIVDSTQVNKISVQNNNKVAAAKKVKYIRHKFKKKSKPASK